MALQAALSRVRRAYPVDLLWRVGERYGRDEGDIYATAVAFRILLSIFPLLIVSVAVFGLLTALPGFGPWLARITADQAPGLRLKQVVESVSGISVSSNSVAGITGLVFLAWSASGMFGTLRLALNSAFGIAGSTEIVRAYALNLAGVGGFFLVGLFSIVLTTMVSILRSQVGRLFTGWPLSLVGGLLDRLLTYGLLFLIALLLYRQVPSSRLPFRDLWPAALVAAAGFQLVEVGFSIYQTYFSDLEAVYGALAGAVALLLFLHIVATIILVAAVLAAELACDRQQPATNE